MAQSKKRGDEFDTPHFEDRRLLDYLLAPEVLDLVECIIGPDILLWSSHFICKDHGLGEQRRGMKTRPTGWEGLTAMTRS